MGTTARPAAGREAARAAGVRPGRVRVGPPGVNAPIRVASDGDDPAPGPSQTDPPGGSGGTPGGDPPGGGTPGGGGEPPRGGTPGGNGTPGGGGDTSGPGGEGPGSGGDMSDPGGDAPGTGGQQLVLDEKTSSGTEPVTDVLGVDGGPAEGGAPAGSVRVLGAQASGGLPVTGLGLLWTFVLGLMFMASGSALRRGGIEPN